MILILTMLACHFAPSEDATYDGCYDYIDNDGDGYVDCDDDDCAFDILCYDYDGSGSSGSGHVICNDGTVSPTCTTCTSGCCSGHGGCASDNACNACNACAA